MYFSAPILAPIFIVVLLVTTRTKTIQSISLVGLKKGDDRVNQLATNPFNGFPETVYILAVSDDKGLYTIHIKLPNGSVKTYPKKCELDEALINVNDLREMLDLPEDSAFINLPESVLNKPNVTNRRLKKFIDNRRLVHE